MIRSESSRSAFLRYRNFSVSGSRSGEEGKGKGKKWREGERGIRSSGENVGKDNTDGREMVLDLEEANRMRTR